MEEVGSWLRVPKSEVYGAATSYANFRFKPPTPHQIKVCCGAACRVSGSARLVQKLEDNLHTRLGAISSDKSLSLEKSDCLFACGAAPVVMVDEVTYGRVDEGKLAELTDSLADSGPPSR
jgi:NADH-quinone oxidoreductase subunit E